jgi:hypothetical protein
MNDDDSWGELLAGFREIEPPASVRAANRAVRAATAPRMTRRWLHRSVATPLPAALATAALLLISLTLNVVLWRGPQAPVDAGAPVEVGTPAEARGATRPAVERRSPSTANLATSEPQLEYSETQRYLSGVGVVDRQASYVFKGLP